MRRRLGQRFVLAGKEVSVQVGTLRIGSDSRAISIIRAQQEDGERVEIALNGDPSSLTWSGTEGAMSAGKQAVGIDRSVIERIALDSPDQFVLSQLRGASYYTIARMVAPAGAGDSDDYSGPLWDMIRIVEPQRGNWAKPQNEWRIYYINNATGLIDKIFYQEQGQDITVELAEWTNRGGEIGPSLIRWIRDGGVEMELSVNNASHGPR